MKFDPKTGRRLARWLPVLAACVGLAATAAPAASAAGDSGRGTLVSATKVAGLSPQRVVRVVGRWREEGNLRLNASTVGDGVDAYRLVYETVGPDGSTPTTASGLVVIPRREVSGRVVVWEHGTTVYKHDAPSTGADADARLVSLLFSGSGFVTVAPDYLGLGVGRGHHPYNHRPSEVSASVDMVRAARTFVTGRGGQWDGRLLVAGFSQGGKVAVAVAGALQAGVDPTLRLAGVAGIAGVYDLQGAQTQARATLDPLGTSFSLAYTAVSWKHLYGLYHDPDEVFLHGQGKKIERLFDGHHDQGEIFGALPPSPRKLFTPAFLALSRHPTGAMLQGVQNSDGACRWAPQAPVRLYAARTDEQVAFLNSRHCQRDFSERGVNVPVAEVGRHGHFGSEIIAVPRVVRWFRELSSGP